jgi:predicted dinucleotide-binding enzyme
MRIGIVGTGGMAVALGTAWAGAGHAVRIGGRSYGNAVAAAARIGGGAEAVRLEEVAGGQDAVLLAVAWQGVPEALRAAGAERGAFEGVPLIDLTNAVEHGVGVLLPEEGRSAAQYVAQWAPGARVVKGFHLFPSAQWAPERPAAGSGSGGGPGGGPGGVPGGVAPDVPLPGGAAPDAPPAPARTVSVVLAGDDPAALETVAQLVRDVGARPVVLGGLDRARQLEEVAGFVIALALNGTDPSTAIPHFPPPADAA